MGKYYYSRLDPKTGQFLPYKEGEKPKKMLDKEKELGIKFEDDYKEQILGEKMGQKRFSLRWGVSGKALIFGRNLRGGRRSWIQMLKLPFKNKVHDEEIRVIPRLACEVCNVSDVSLDNAHWVENINGGSTKYYNILKLCPNCHRKLDNADEATTEKARSNLLLKVIKKTLDTGQNDEELKREFLARIEPIILHRRKKP